MTKEELYRFMESEYRKRGASNNGAQLIMRSNHFDFMVEFLGLKEVERMLKEDFDMYHFWR